MKGMKLDSYISKLNRKYSSIKPIPKRDLEQYAVDLTSVHNRLQEILKFTTKGNGLLVGDDDLISLFLLNQSLNLTVVEKDKRVISAILDNMPKNSNIDFVDFDLRNIYKNIWPLKTQHFDFFVTSPPYTKEGMKIFSSLGIKRLKVGGFGFIASPYDIDKKANEVTIEVMKFVLANGCIIHKVIPGLTIEEGLPAYQIIIKKIKDIDSIDWLGKMSGKMYEWEAYNKQDAYNHQIF